VDFLIRVGFYNPIEGQFIMKKLACFAASVLLSSISASAAYAADKFEAVTVPGSEKNNAAFFRIEVATGKVVSDWGAGNQTFATTTDTTPLPPGEYHLYVSTNPQVDGVTTWNMDRMEANTGHVWSLTGGGSTPYFWVAVPEPK
jgi:hypothetical protein